MKCPNCHQRYFPTSGDLLKCEHCGHTFNIQDALPESFEETWERIKTTQASWPKRPMSVLPIKPRP